MTYFNELNEKYYSKHNWSKSILGLTIWVISVQATKIRLALVLIANSGV